MRRKDSSYHWAFFGSGWTGLPWQLSAPTVLFVHIPPFAVHGGPLSESALLDGAEDILRFALAFANAEAEPLASSASASQRARL